MMPPSALIWTVALAIPVGFAADFVGAPPAWLRRAVSLLFTLPLAAAVRVRRVRRVALLRPGIRAERRRVAAVASAATVVGIGGTFAVRLLAYAVILLLHVAGLRGLGLTVALAVAIAAAATAAGAWLAMAHATRRAQRHAVRRAR